VPLALDTSTEFGSRVQRRLREEPIGWLVTVSADGVPQPSPVWFLWDGGDSFLVYSQPDTPKLRNIAANPRVALHLEGDGGGGDIVVMTGTAAESDDPPAYEVPEYLAKYGDRIRGEGKSWGGTAEGFAASYSVPLRVTATRLRGH
jgi:PPOX class probable F420-dependent enzyme